MKEYLPQIFSVLQCIAAIFFVAILAWFAPLLGASISRRTSRFLREAAARPRLILLFPALASVAVSIVVFAVAGPPLPHIHDEFAHLLAADTFAHGRLTNPTPLDWPSFETMHVLMQPTYMSKFGPAQGFTLAIGQAVFNQPWMGLILTTALACEAMAWCLRGFFPPPWALAGGLLAAVHPEIIIWSHEYWGGNVGLIGGALVLGGLVRLDSALRTGRPRVPSRANRTELLNAALLALGLGILANSRPYEAAVWGLISLVWILNRIHVAPSNPLNHFARIAFGIALVLAPIGAFMGYYNYRITGHATELPYTEHVRQYMAVPLFFWQKPEPPKSYNNPQFVSQYDGYERWYFNEQRNLRGWLQWAGYKIYKYAEFHLLRNLVLSIGLIAFVIGRIRAARPLDSRIRLALFAAAMFVIAYAIIPWFEDHYTGASLALLFVISLHGIREIKSWRLSGALNASRDMGVSPMASTEGAGNERDTPDAGKVLDYVSIPVTRLPARPIGRAIVCYAAISCAIVMTFVTYRERRNQTYGMQIQRANLEAQFKRDGGKHLVIVHYDDHHFTGSEWVYNKADLNTADVIYARHLSDARTHPS